METLTTMTYERDGRIARITLEPPRARQRDHARDAARAGGMRRAREPRPRGPRDRARRQRQGLLRRLRPGGSAEEGMPPERRRGRPGGAAGLAARPGGPGARTTTRSATWDPVVDFQMMSRNVRGFMSLFHSEKPVVCKVHGFCVAGGTDMALCSDLLVVEDKAKIGYPPARVWGVPTTALWAWRIGPARAKRLLLTGDSHLGHRGGRVGARDRGGAGRRARRALRGAAGAGRARARQPARHAQAARQPGPLRAGACTQPRCWARSSTGSRATRPRARVRRAARPRRAGAGGARARRAVRRPRALDVQGMRDG